MPQDEFDTLYHACFDARSQYHVEYTSDIGKYVVRCLGGHIAVTEQHVDMILLDEYKESVAALQTVSPMKSRTRLSPTDAMRIAKEQRAPTPPKGLTFPPTPEGNAAARAQARAPPAGAPPAAKSSAAANPGVQTGTANAGLAQQLTSFQAQLNAFTNPPSQG